MGARDFFRRLSRTIPFTFKMQKLLVKETVTGTLALASRLVFFFLSVRGEERCTKCCGPLIAALGPFGPAKVKTLLLPVLIEQALAPLGYIYFFLIKKEKL